MVTMVTVLVWHVNNNKPEADGNGITLPGIWLETKIFYDGAR